MSDHENEFQVDAPDARPPELTANQARVLASLVEKHLATPNSYPLTVHSLVTACNQKTNRQPVMALTEGEVGHICNELVTLDLVKIEYGSRANKMNHLVMRSLNLSREELAVLSILMLREPLTLSEIKARTDRMVAFESIDKVQTTVQRMLDRTYPLLVLLGKGSGQREDRYSHTLCGEVDISAFSFDASPVTSGATSPAVDSNLLKRIEQLEEKVAKLMELIE